MSFKSVLFGFVVFCGLGLAACGGGGAASADSSNEVGVTVGSVDPPVVDGGDSDPDTTAVALLFDGFSGDNSSTPTSEGGETETTDGENQGTSITTVSPGTTVVKEKLIFKAPQDCQATPTGGSSEDFVEALYRNCLYRPIAVDSSQPWVERINNNKHSPEWVRDVGVYRSPESRCLLGEPEYQEEADCDDNNIVETMEKYEVVCDVESFAATEVKVLTTRIAQRIQNLCPEFKFDIKE